jgi:hypothetical protein
MNHHLLKHDLAGAYPEKSVAVNDVFAPILFERVQRECFSLSPPALLQRKGF